MPFAYYSRAATTQFWSEHWGRHSVEELLRVAQTSPLTSLLERHLPRQGSSLPAPGEGSSRRGASRALRALLYSGPGLRVFGHMLLAVGIRR